MIIFFLCRVQVNDVLLTHSSVIQIYQKNKNCCSIIGLLSECHNLIALFEMMTYKNKIALITNSSTFKVAFPKKHHLTYYEY